MPAFDLTTAEGRAALDDHIRRSESEWAFRARSFIALTGRVVPSICDYRRIGWDAEFTAGVINLSIELQRSGALDCDDE